MSSPTKIETPPPSPAEIVAWIRPTIRAMEPYQPIYPFDVLAEQLGYAPEDLIKLDANENPYGPPPAVHEALAHLRYVHIYPDPESHTLRRAIADFLNIPIDHILAGAGADELIDLIMRLFLEPGDAVLTCPPTFGMYAFDTELNAGQTISVPRKPDFQIDIDAVEQAVYEHRPKLLFLASPNNPDGSWLSDEEVKHLLRLPVVLVLDEAYVEFVGFEQSRAYWVPHYANLIVLRTFSKWAGLAGLRVGYGIFPTHLMPHLWKIKQPYNVTVAASAAAIAALSQHEILRQRLQQIIAERERMLKLLAEIPYLVPYPTRANFILCRVLGRDARALKEELAQRGILIRYFDKPGLRDHIRISVGRPEQTDTLIATLQALA